MEPSKSTHQEVRSMFPALVDDELPMDMVANLRAHLDNCAECRNGWVRYERAVSLVRKVPKEKAPAALTGAILRRIRRQKSRALRRDATLAMAYRVPYGMVLPILLAAAVGALIFFLLKS
ncbi:MAG TPA: zf-HC2 domain-containing protein [Myxococcaceae bacterium]|nr:zf-HC2 domain-containing protein [Myxococcaceae bacterium]